MPRDACATGMCNGKCGAPMEHGEAPIPRPCLLAVASRERRYLLYAQRINSLTLESLHLESISARANTYMRAERAKYRVLKTWSGSTHLAFGFAGSSPPHSLHVLLRRPCSQREAPPHSLHVLLRRPCSQMEAPPHSLHWLLCRLCSQREEPPHSLH